jgi:hypothetical protein
MTNVPVKWTHRRWYICMVYNVPQLNVTVQAYDILGNYNDETVTVYRDATPPIIENLWLTRGDRLNVSVHSLEDFTKMTWVK